MNPLRLRVEERHVVPTLTVDNKNPNAGEDVTFTLNIVNEGNVPYSDMTVLMNGEAVDFPARYLNPGDDYSEDYTMSFQISTDVVFKISLKDHTGNTVSVNSNTISIQLPVDPDAIKDKLTFNISVDRPALTSESTINFNGQYNQTRPTTRLLIISVDEPTLGNVFLADELDAAYSKKLEFSADINETTTYEFVLTVKDRDGKTYTVNAEPITVTVTSVAIEDDEEEFDDAAVVDNPRAGAYHRLWRYWHPWHLRYNTNSAYSTDNWRRRCTSCPLAKGCIITVQNLRTAEGRQEAFC